MSRARNEWRLEDHVCRVCFGRIASRDADDDEDNRLYQCTNCGTSAVGHKPSVLCACGTKIKREGGKSIDAGLRCHRNGSQSPSFPSVIVASFNGVQPEI